MSHPLGKYLETLSEGFQLTVIADDIVKGQVKNLARKKRALYRASIIHLCAAWEAFLEAATEKSLNYILDHANSPSIIPANLQARIGAKLKTEKDDRLLWRICGDGWKKELKDNYSTLKERFNTPRPEKTD